MRSDRSRGELEIARIDRADLHALVDLHMRAFPGGALTVFGGGAVRRYYEWLLEGPHEAALVGAWHGDTLVGFCAAGWFRGAMSGFLRTNRWYLAALVMRHPKLLATPLVRDRVGQALQITLRYSRLRRAAPVGSLGDVPRFGVLSIATDPAVLGIGAGRALMQEAEDRARREGHHVMVLTVHPDNHRAVSFYEQLGWTRCSSDDGSWSGKMEKQLS
jgi:ribosomal protein S18 acetylase RimI-like enzyme